MRVPRLRVAFLSWFETGFDQNLGVVVREHGRESYEIVLHWIDEAAGKDMEVSLVMPNMFHHGELERSRGDSFRINDDADLGGSDGGAAITRARRHEPQMIIVNGDCSCWPP